MARVPSFSPPRESRALSPIQPDAGLQELPRWDVDPSTRRALDGNSGSRPIAGALDWPTAAGIMREGPAVIAFRVIRFGVMVYNNAEPPAGYDL